MLVQQEIFVLGLGSSQAISSVTDIQQALFRHRGSKVKFHSHEWDAKSRHR